jgi:ankyrin repeat protein
LKGSQPLAEFRIMFGDIFKPKDLYSAAKKGNTKVIEELVARGHDVNVKKAGFVREGYTPLHFAVLHERKDAIKTLVKLGADVNAKNKESETPLWIAVSELKNSGEAKLKVELSPNGHDPSISFAGTVEYRVFSSEDNTEPWKPMKRGRKDEENNVRFSDSVPLSKGTVFVQFRVHPEWENDPTILKDWKIEVE